VRLNKWTTVLVAAGTVVAVTGITSAAVAAPPPPPTPQTFTVGVGGDRAVRGIPLEGMRFDAPTLNVHKNDILQFNFLGFHTVTAIPVSTNAEDWRAVHQAPGGDYALIQPDSDDTPPAFQLNHKVVFPTNASCGATDNPCPYAGNAVVSSGLPTGNQQSFSIKVTQGAGKSFWVLCLLHGMMDLKVNVVPDATATTTQAQINNYASATNAADNDQAASLIPKLEKQTSRRVGGRTLVDAYAGFDGTGWGLDAMFPRTIHIKKGQTVRWHFQQLTGNIHSVTFPRGAAGSFANNDFSGQRAKCEADPTDTAPDSPPPTFCSTGGVNSLELEIRANALLRRGGHSYNGTGLASSGVRGADAGIFTPYTLRFTKKSSASGFSYACNIHGEMMTGYVVVS